MPQDPFGLFEEEGKKDPYGLFSDEQQAGPSKPPSAMVENQQPMALGGRFPIDPNLEEKRKRDIETFKTAARNLLPSIYDIGKNIVNAVSHPIDTFTGVKNVMLGAMEKLTPGDRGKHELYADQFADFFVKRYGGEEEIRKTLEEDPAGLLADVSTFLSGGGAAIRGVGATIKASDVSKLGVTIGNIGAKIDPVSLMLTFPVNTAGKVVPKTGRLSPESMYESALKPSTTLSMEERLSLSSTALENNIMPTREGLIKTRTLIDDIESVVTDVVNTGAHRGDRVNITNAVQPLNDLRSKLSETIEPEKYLKKINKVERNFLDAYGHDIPVDVAQRVKKNTYWELKNLYGELQKDAAVEAKKTIARGIKEEIYNLYPELRELGKKEGALIELESSIERASSRISNRDLFGIGVPVKGTMGGVIAGPTGGVIGLILGVLDTPNVKSRLSHALYKARQGIAALPYSKTRMMAFQAGRNEEEIIGENE